MKTFNEIFQETKLKYPNCSNEEIVIKAREKYIFDNQKL